ncbi:hypothetical protein BJ912DRAFT_101563 [Pholiota molesta]|nr:hypothetical protein BJ912DRAFT_101563 [Pholiota molesta]
MPYYINGYFMTIQEARKLGTRLGIDVAEDNRYYNVHLELVFNDWLFNNGKLETKSALISWPRGQIDGIVFISHFRLQAPPRGDKDEPREEDLKIKAWLEDLGVEGLQWVSKWDERGTITLNGTEPSRSYRTGTAPVPLAYYGGPPDPNKPLPSWKNMRRNMK